MANRKFTVVACLNRAYPLKIAHSRERISIREYTIRVPANREIFDCQFRKYIHAYRIYSKSHKNLTRKVNSILKDLILMKIYVYKVYFVSPKKSTFKFLSFLRIFRTHLDFTWKIFYDRNENNINIFMNIHCTENYKFLCCFDNLINLYFRVCIYIGKDSFYLAKYIV